MKKSKDILKLVIVIILVLVILGLLVYSASIERNLVFKGDIACKDANFKDFNWTKSYVLDETHVNCCQVEIIETETGTFISNEICKGVTIE